MCIRDRTKRSTDDWRGLVYYVNDSVPSYVTHTGNSGIRSVILYFPLAIISPIGTAFNSLSQNSTQKVARNGWFARTECVESWKESEFSHRFSRIQHWQRSWKRGAERRLQFRQTNGSYTYNVTAQEAVSYTHLFVEVLCKVTLLFYKLCVTLLFDIII